jgi:hypothetical protein
LNLRFEDALEWLGRGTVDRMLHPTVIESPVVIGVRPGV